jgi:Fe-S cluster assembly protein SufD
MTSSSVHNHLMDALVGEPVHPHPLRAEALRIFRSLGLPGTKHEEYKHTPITRTLEKALSLNASFVSTGKLPDQKLWQIAEPDAYQAVLLNGVWVPEKSSLPDYVTALPMHFASTKLEQASDSLGRYADFRSDAFAAWNTASWSDGLFLEIPAGVTMDKPLIIYYLHDSSSGPVKAVTRNLVLAGANSEVSIIEKWHTSGNNPAISNSFSEIVLHDQARLNHLVIQADNELHIQYLFNQFWQNTGSRLNSHVITLDGAFIRNNTRVALDGENCESHLYGLYLLHKNSVADNHTVVDHRKPNSFSNELYKGILEDQAKGVFNGKIFVRPDAQKTNAFQSNRNILLSDKATINTKPQLEIWADDVKCSHGCTTGQLDKEALFYLRARGIDKDTARAMVLYAFASELLETVAHPGLKHYLDNLVSERLHKNF